QDILRQAINKLQSVENWTANDLQTALNELLESTSRKPAELFGLIRLAVSFAPFSPALHDTLSVLGRERSLARLNAVITAYSRD
ncbi:glutamate--tRNA ligase, partial [Candidatus Saccharibacteria bacterium]|nr:glutamate--tRNA ligase [Candidatus Saccharibacteria bacterium]